MSGHIRLIVVFGLAIVMLVVLLPIHLLALLFAKLGWVRPAGTIPVIFHRVLLKLFGVRLTVKGNLERSRPLLLVANHVSWLDIPVLGALAPLSFVAKSEMRSWPLFGNLARLQRTVFVERNLRRTAQIQANEVAERMTAREIMVLFPEGTTSDGNRLLPFKTPIFEASKIALAASPVEQAMVQPIAVHYTHLHGLPLGRADRPHVAWPGEVGLAESLLPLVARGALDVTLHLGEPIPLTETSNRKIVAAQSAQSIRDLMV